MTSIASTTATTTVSINVNSTPTDVNATTQTTQTAPTTSVTTAPQTQTTTITATTTIATTATTATTTTVSIGTASTTIDTIPPIISSVSASNVTQTEATITWSTNELADSLVQYGTSQSYGQISQNTSLTTIHILNITGLSANTLYHYQVKSKDGSGNEGSSNDNTFTTLAAVSENIPGSLKWVFTAFSGEYNAGSALAVAQDGTIYFGTRKLTALNPDGTQKWIFTYDEDVNVFPLPPPVIGSDGTIYRANGSFLYAISPDGALNWEFLVGDTIFAAPAIAQDGTIYVWSNDGKVYAIKSSSTGLANSTWPKTYKNNRNTNYAGDPIVLSPAKSNLAAVLFSLSRVLDKIWELFK